jgi:hypothetical protein
LAEKESAAFAEARLHGTSHRGHHHSPTATLGWKDVKSNALEPGWIATKMGGSSAPDDLHQGCVTQAWLATSEDELAQSSGGYFCHQRPGAPNPIGADLRVQEELLAECHRISGIPLE